MQLKSIAKTLKTTVTELKRICATIGVEAKTGDTEIDEETHKKIKAAFSTVEKTKKQAQKTTKSVKKSATSLKTVAEEKKKKKETETKTEAQPTQITKRPPESKTEPKAKKPRKAPTVVDTVIIEQPKPDAVEPAPAVAEPKPAPKEEPKQATPEKQIEEKEKIPEAEVETAETIEEKKKPPIPEKDEEAELLPSKLKQIEEKQFAKVPQKVKPKIVVPEDQAIKKIVKPPETKPPAVKETPKPAEIKAPEKIAKISEMSAVKELADVLAVKPAELIKALMELGIMATINQKISFDVSSLIAEKFGFKPEVVRLYGEDILELEDEKDPEDQLKLRPPIVTIMGHVDHGKTSLLDSIRQTNVTDQEKGEITQHIGAYEVFVKDTGITFLDTPGHEAFTAMRARGAQITDIVVLVVAADDGVKPQTVEALSHAKAAGVPIVVAINKIDKEGSAPDRVKQQLANYDLIPEEWGGKTIYCEISARQKLGIDRLLEMLILEAEVLELKANPDRAAAGTVIEAKLEKKRGNMATVLIQKGTLKTGDAFVAGYQYGKVRAMLNDKGHFIKTATPSTPVVVLGINGLPQAGDKFKVVSTDTLAREIGEKRFEMERLKKMLLSHKPKHISLQDLSKRISEGAIKELRIILKADVQGSIEVAAEMLEKLSTEKVKINIIYRGIGGVTTSDMNLGAASDAIVVGFHVRGEPGVEEIGEKESVELRFYDVIYDIAEDIKKAMEGLLPALKKEVVIGRAEVLKIYKISKVGTIAGCLVKTGKIERTANVRVLRDLIIVYQGKFSSLKRFKDDVREVQQGLECGVGIENFNDMKTGDVLEVFIIEKVAQNL